MYAKHIEYKDHMQFLQAQINKAVRLLMETMGGYLNIKFIHFVLIETIRIDHRAVISVGG